MPDGLVLEFSGVTKRFGAVTAVDGFTARVEPGQVTGFLGPNGAGKTTSLRILLGLVKSTAGTATIGGMPYAKLRDPLRTVGAVLEASSFHPGRSGANHLKVYAQAAGLPGSRVDEALGLVGLAEVGGRKVGGYSLGMRQRLGLAYALLGDPGVLVLDEPANGLDPEGIKWMRGLLRDLARQGRTVFVSSHLLAEVQQTADSLLIISRGRLVFQGGLEELTDPAEYATVVDSPDRTALLGALRSAGVEAEVLRAGIVVRGVETAAVGQVAANAGVALSVLQRRGPALEEVFLDLVSGVRLHASAAPRAMTGHEAAVTGPAIAQTEVTETADTAPDAAATAVAIDEAAASEPAAAAAGAALGAAVAVASAEQSEPADDASESPPPATAAGDDTDSVENVEFVVASTGVIDIVSAADAAEEPEAAAGVDGEPERADTAAAEQVDVSTAGVFTVDPTGEAVAAEALGHDAGESGAEAAEPTADPVDDAPAAEPADVPAEDDASPSGRPWEKYSKTDADREADRFFAAFSGEDSGASEEQAAAEARPEAEPDVSPADHAKDPEGGDER